MLRRLNHGAQLGMAQEVAVIDDAQAEEFKQVVALGGDGVVELAGVASDEFCRALADQPRLVCHLNGLRERVDVLVLDFLVYVGGEDAGGKTGIVGLVGDETGGGADGELVQLGGGGAVAEAADGLGGDTQGVYAFQPFA